jgi:hypothetical protein
MNNDNNSEKKENSVSEKNSPIKLEEISFEHLDPEETKKEITAPTKSNNIYNPGTIFYDKYSKRLIYFNISKNEIYLYNRVKTSLLKKINVVFNFKVLNACVDKKLTFLLIYANPNMNNKFIFVYNIEKESFFSQIKKDFTSLLNMFFIESNIFCLAYVDKIEIHLCDQNSDEVKQIKLLDYSKMLINNFYFVKQYLILLIYKGDNSFDLYSLRKNEVELIKSFRQVFQTKSNIFKNPRGSFFSSFFSAKNNTLQKQKTQIINEYNDTYNLMYKKSQIFLEFIYSQLYFIILSYEDDAILLMKIGNINKFPKEEEENKTIKLEYKTHSNNSTIQFLDNLLFVHNFTTNDTIIFDIKLQSKQKIICQSQNVLNNFKKKDFLSMKIIGGNIEETIQVGGEKEPEIKKKLYSLNVDLGNLFKNNEDKRETNPGDEGELEGMLMIARRNKSKIFFLELFRNMLLDINIKHRTDKVLLLLNEFFRQIQKSNALALILVKNMPEIDEREGSSKAVKLSYKKVNDKFYLDDKYILLSTKNTLSLMEVLKSFKSLAEEKDSNIKESHIFEYLIFILFFTLKLTSNKIELIQLYDDTIFTMFNQIKSEKSMIKFVLNFVNSYAFPFGTIEIAKYLLNNFTDPELKVEGYKILLNFKQYNDLFHYLLKNENFSYVLQFLEENYEKIKESEIKKYLIEYLNSHSDREQISEYLNDIVQDEDEE